MFKKTLLALALTGLAGTASAADIANNKAVFSAEGIAQVTSVDLDAAVADVTGGSVSVTVEKDYQIGDSLVFTFPNDKFAVGTKAEVSATGSATVAFAALVEDTVYSGGDTVSFELKTALTEGDVLLLKGVVLDSANLQSGGTVVVSFNGQSQITEGAFDKATSLEVATAETELKASIAAGDRLGSSKVDVSQGRLLFADNGKSDSLTVTAALTADVAEPVEVTKTVYTLNGDFSFLDTDGDGEAEYTISTGTVADDFQSITVEESAAFDGFTIDIEATDGTTVIPVQDFSVDAVVTYKIDDADGDEVSETKSFSLYAGSWVLNGHSSRVNFLPFGSQYAQSVTVTNLGNVEGAISISLTADGKTVETELASVAKAQAVTDISKEVSAFAAKEGVTGNATFEIIVDAPSTQIHTDAVYYSKADADRVKTK